VGQHYRKEELGMYQFFVEPNQVQENQIFITGSDVNHIRNVLRMKMGEHIRVSDNSGRSFFCHIREIGSDTVIADIDETDETGTELKNRILLFQGLPKADKMELIIQKSVELGVSGIIPVAMKNCVVRLDEKKAASKTSRWQAIAESAAKQSKRTVIPRIHEPVSWKEALNLAKTLDITLVPYENERGMDATREIIGSIAPDKTIGIMIGPEGGFSDAEIQMADETGFHRISLGRRILRTETAGPATLAMLVYALDI
jgi:16S rRNA (uracil1498-N3)-methyltransferase